MPAARDCPEGLDPQKTLNKLLHSSRAYKSASVLSLYWEDDEMGCINEVEKINTLFKKEFGYDVDRFGIPTQSPYWGLNAKISEFVRVRNKPDSLLIIYYGGHGVSDMKEGRYGSVWAAKRNGGPTLRWDHIQRSLEEVEADVLLILDCCYAAQAARSRTSHKFQLLAAAAMGVQTPVVGEKSFTSLLVKQIRLLLHEHRAVDISQLHFRLNQRNAKLQETPVHIDLSDNLGSMPMILKPLLAEGASKEEIKSGPSFTIKFHVHQTKNLTEEEEILKIATWLGSAPGMVSGIYCTAVTIGTGVTPSAETTHNSKKSHIHKQPQSYLKNSSLCPPFPPPPSSPTFDFSPPLGMTKTSISPLPKMPRPALESPSAALPPSTWRPISPPSSPSSPPRSSSLPCAGNHHSTARPTTPSPPTQLATPPSSPPTMPPSGKKTKPPLPPKRPKEKTSTSAVPSTPFKRRKSTPLAKPTPPAKPLPYKQTKTTLEPSAL